MYSLPELQEILKARQIQLSLQGSELRVKAPRGSLSPELQAALRAHKAALCAELAREQPVALDFSLFFFGRSNPAKSGYTTLLQLAQQAEALGCTAIWTPERHFDALGGDFPSPAVLAAALARETRSIKLRAGSVVLPLQDPIRVVEDWSVVDQLSAGRVELSFASGWHSNDFALAPENYAQRHALMYERLDTVRRLWRGEAILRREGSGDQIAVRTWPRPWQPELPVWITAIGNPDSYRRIGQAGCHLLTCLLDQEVEELAEKLVLYRQALAQAGHDPQAFRVGVFLHTYLGSELETVRSEIQAPFKAYLRSTLHLLGKLSHSAGLPLNPEAFSTDEQEALLDYAFERYLSRRSLMGTPASVRPLLQQLAAAGVQEVACLVDFGPTAEQMRQSLALLGQLLNRPAASTAPAG